MAKLHFTLVTPEREFLSTDVYQVVVPGIEGEFGVLAGHAPFMTVLKSGELKVYADGNTVTSRIHVEGGFAEVGAQGLTVLAEAATEVA